jgi:hypothetical protein
MAFYLIAGKKTAPTKPLQRGKLQRIFAEKPENVDFIKSGMAKFENQLLIWAYKMQLQNYFNLSYFVTCPIKQQGSYV